MIKYRGPEISEVTHGWPHASTSEHLNGRKVSIIPWGFAGIGRDNMLSCEFSSCVPLVVGNDSSMGMAHILYPDDAEFYVEKFKRKLGNIKALIIGGNYKQLVKACEKHKVPIDVKDHGYYYRDVLVVPSTREVMVFFRSNRLTYVMD